MAAKERELEQIQDENSKALKRLESLYLALTDLEAFERVVLAAGKNYPASQTLPRPPKPPGPNHVN